MQGSWRGVDEILYVLLLLRRQSSPCLCCSTVPARPLAPNPRGSGDWGDGVDPRPGQVCKGSSPALGFAVMLNWGVFAIIILELSANWTVTSLHLDAGLAGSSAVLPQPGLPFPPPAGFSAPIVLGVSRQLTEPPCATIARLRRVLVQDKTDV